MKIRNNIIIATAAIGILLTILVQGYVIPANNQKKLQYAINQQNPETHDLKSIIKYKNKYMGNMSNLSNLFYNLPLGNGGITFQLFPDRLAADINYKESENSINREDNYRSLRTVIYNSTAAFALIDNLQEIHMSFAGSSYIITRKDLEKWYGTKVQGLLDENVWKSAVQSRLKDDSYIKSFSDVILLQNSK